MEEEGDVLWLFREAHIQSSAREAKNHSSHVPG